MTYKPQLYNIYKKVVIIMIIKTTKTMQLYYKAVIWRAGGEGGGEWSYKKVLLKISQNSLGKRVF